MPDRPDIERLSSRKVYANPWIAVREDTIRRRDGSEDIYGCVEKPDFVVIAALGDGHLHLVEQFRYPVGRRLWELPQGTAAGATPEDQARTELREETGLTAKTWRNLGYMMPCAGLIAHGFIAYLATDLTPGNDALEDSEADLITHAFPIDDVLQMVWDGVLVDAPSICTLMKLKLAGVI